MDVDEIINSTPGLESDESSAHVSEILNDKGIFGDDDEDNEETKEEKEELEEKKDEDELELEEKIDEDEEIISKPKKFSSKANIPSYHKIPKTLC